ncbi:MAG: beta-ketoacyl synthase chain length factor [Treponema sp.]|nr:beta-ketoacyl synthase chain length factor [Treponema sp.]
MINDEIFITRLSAWAPGIKSPDEWNEWAQGRRHISSEMKGPGIDFTDPMLRRRLSQISKMTIQVIHDLLPLKENTKIYFISFRGEITRQFQINKMLIEENELTPTPFSLSVFNTPVAMASIALGLRGGYTALYPAGNNPFATGLAAAEAALLCGTVQEIAFVYADEQMPAVYEAISRHVNDTGSHPPAAFGLLLSREPRPFSVSLSVFKEEEGTQSSPLNFLKKLLLHGDIHIAA